MMFNKLWFKLTSAFLLVAVVVVALVAFLANRATNAGFIRFLNQDNAAATVEVQTALAMYYSRQGSWEGVESLLRNYRPGQGTGGGGGVMTLLDDEGQVVVTIGGGRGQRPDGAGVGEGVPILADGRPVGVLLWERAGPAGGQAGQQFLASVNQVLILAGLAAVMLALLMGALLARSLTRPARQLTQATRALAGGDLSQKVKVKSHDELGELADSFNQMAAALAENEVQRQQLFADIAHELRTPLSVIRGQVEGMLDGVFEMTPENLSVVHEETILLSQLVDQLRTLSLAESGQLPLQQQALDIGEIVRQAAAAFEPLAEVEGIRLLVDIEPDLPPVPADPARIQQVLGNLLANALRHSGGNDAGQPEVHLEVTARSDRLRVSVADNGPGLSAEAQRHVFDRFWRADASRNRHQGGSGLGLAICRGIVQAHGGRIWVESSPGRGATFSFELPAGQE